MLTYQDIIKDVENQKYNIVIKRRKPEYAVMSVKTREKILMEIEDAYYHCHGFEPETVCGLKVLFDDNLDLGVVKVK